MRFAVYGLIVSILMLVSIGHVGAQDDLKPASVLLNNTSDLIELSLYLNICPEEIVATNPQLFKDEHQMMTYNELRSGSFWDGDLKTPSGVIFLPLHTPCYKHIDAKDAAEVESRYNICVEEVLKWQIPSRGYVLDKGLYIRRNALPCFNAQKQRLQYHIIWGKRLPQPYYSELPYTLPPADACLGDLIRSNPQVYNHMEGGSYLNGTYGNYLNQKQFVPDDVRHCREVNIRADNLYEISQRENVCIETILDVSGLKLMNWERRTGYVLVPLDAPACYDAQGERLDHQDRAIHTLKPNETLSDVAGQYRVCFQDLWDANPALAYWRYYWDELKNLNTLFIPDTPCNQSPITFKTLPHHSLHAVSLLANVCINRLIEANPQYPHLNDLKWSQEFGEAITLIIPDRPPCYDFSNLMHGLKMQSYICYAVPVTEGDDFTGQVPPVSPSSALEASNCYERKLGMTIIYENQPHTLFALQGYIPLLVASQCFDIEESKFILFSPNEYNWYSSPALFLVPQPHADCGLNTTDDQLHSQAYREISYKAGYLIDGVYTTNRGDTLSSIGHKFGYLPQWIADVNNLSDPEMIYFLQELKMPSFPSLYTFVPIGGAAGFTVLMSTAIYRLWRWRRNRYINKKKKNAA